MADISKIKALNGTTYNIKDATARSSFENLNASNLKSGSVPSARLPVASSSALGAIKVGPGLSISNGILSANDQLPAVTTFDNGKFLQVVNGNWVAVEYAAAEGEEF